jgi:hypothetical protein
MLWQCIPLLVGLGIVGAFAVRMTFGLPLAKLAGPIAALLAIQVAFLIVMYAARKRYQKTQDLRSAFILASIYGLVIGLTGMYYAAQLGIVGARTFDDNCIGFSIYVGVVICIGVGCLSLFKRKLTP